MAEIRTEQPLTEEEQKLVDEAYSRVKIWRDGCREFHERAKVARDIMLLKDPYQDPPGTPPERRAIQLNTLKSTVNNCAADQVDNVMEARLLPETETTQDLADDMNDIVSYIYEYNDYPALHKTRVEDMLYTGTAITQVMWDAEAQKGKGEVTFVRVPVENFLYDPKAANIQDARALMKISWHPLSWYKAHYPDKGEYVHADEHSADAVGEADNQEQLGADEESAMLVEYWYRLYDAEKKKYTINVAYLAGRALLESYKDVYAHGLYPFIVDVFTEIKDLPIGEGLVMELAPTMRTINRYNKYIDANCRAAAKTRLLLSEASDIDPDEIADWNNDIVKGRRVDETAVRFMNTPPFSNLPISMLQLLQSQLKEDSGQSAFARGEVEGSVHAATAIQSLQEAGGKQTRMRTETLKRGFKRMTEQVLWLVSQFYEENRVVQITGRRGSIRKIDASPSRLMNRHGSVVPPPPYIVRVAVERMNPNVVSEQNQLFIDTYKMSAEAGNPFPLSALFRILNLDGKDKLLPIIESVENYVEALQSLRQQNEQLQAQLAQQQQSIEGLKDNMVRQAQSQPQQAEPARKPSFGKLFSNVGDKSPLG